LPPLLLAYTSAVSITPYNVTLLWAWATPADRAGTTANEAMSFFIVIREGELSEWV
jgi:hypothetical protein